MMDVQMYQPRKKSSLNKKILNYLSLFIIVLGFSFLPTQDVYAKNVCKASSGATCWCDGGCHANKTQCWCDNN